MLDEIWSDESFRRLSEEPLQASNRDEVRLFAQVRLDESLFRFSFFFKLNSVTNRSWLTQAFLSNFIYSRRTEAIFAQGRDSLLQLRTEKEKLAARLQEITAQADLSVKMM